MSSFKRSFKSMKSKKKEKEETQTTLKDYTPTNFVSKSLKLTPVDHINEIMFLLYYKPSKIGRAQISSGRGSSISNVQKGKRSFKSVHSSSLSAIGSFSGDSPKRIASRYNMPWSSLTSLLGLGRKKPSVFGKDVRSQVSGVPSIFRIRSDPWPKHREPLKTFTVTITESDTMILCMFPSRSAIEGTPRADAIVENNNAYWARVKTYKKMYNVEAQTPDVHLTDRWLGTSKNTRNNELVQVCYSDIYDSCKGAENKVHESTPPVEIDSTGKNDLLDLDDELGEACKIVELAESAELLNSCSYLLRCVRRNVDWRKQMIFKKGSVFDPFAFQCPITYNIDHLWTLRFINVWGMPVTSLSINPVNNNILAVGHGMYFMDQPQHLGRVCIWNFKNCYFPEKHMDFRDGVTSLEFSRIHPFALLVSLVSGSVSIVDISKPTLQVLISYGNDFTYEHIWQVRWYAFDTDNEEPVACAENGKVYIMNKSNLLKKTFLNLSRREGVVKGIPLPKTCRKPLSISCRPSVMCIAVNPDSYYDYMVGTDDGCVHICSTDYWHEHTDVFQAHIGPVHHIKYHPDCSKIFLTVGVDYFVRIWARGVFQPIVSLCESDFSFEDADWSGVNPNILATVCSNRVDIWDISRLKLVPQGFNSSPTDSRFTLVKFTHNGSNLICGDVSGDLHVYKLSNMPFLFKDKMRVLMKTFKRILLGNKDLLDKLKPLGPPFDLLYDPSL